MSDVTDILPAHLTQAELATRWRITTRTLDRWRVDGRGPAWMRLNSRILYRAEDVLAFERVRLRQSVR
jgi:predicted site-specific integrase-resolvase